MIRNKKWSELSGEQKAAALLLALIQWSLAGVALYDIYKRPAELVNGSKNKWYGIALISWVGPVAWFIWGRKRTATA